MESRILPFLRASVAPIFKRSRDLDVARDLGHSPVLTRFAFFWLVSGPLPSIHVQNLRLVPSPVPEILGVPEI